MLRGVGRDGIISEADIANEVEVMMSLRPYSHENIIEILDHGSLGEHTNLYFIDMEHCDINLSEYIHGKRCGVHGLKDFAEWINIGEVSFLICAIVQQIVRGLMFLHGHDKVHRDLKPENSMPLSV